MVQKLTPTSALIKLPVRSVLEYGANVWQSGLTNQSKMTLKDYKNSLKIILKDNYVTYKNALKFMNMDLLERNREKLNLNFAKKCSIIDRMKLLFPLNSKNHEMKTKSH